MLKRLWQILGPVICAMTLVVLLFALYPTKLKHSVDREKKDAVSLTTSTFKSKLQKLRALSDSQHRFVPFFGSSEWSRMDKMHPSVLAEAYQRSYTPYLLGQKGAASFTQYFGIQQIGKQLEGKQAVYFISPQWFTKSGANKAAFQKYFSSGQMIDFLQEQTGTAYDRYAAKRFLKMYPDASLKGLMKKVAKGQKLSDADKHSLALQEKIYQKEDAFFSQFSLSNTYKKKIVPQAKNLPATFSYDRLTAIARRDGKEGTSNNTFGIENQFFENRVQKNLKNLKGSQRTFSYTKSPEYNDLQLVLHQFAKTHTNVLFVIPPVNSKWSKYTGLNQDMYQKAVAKIKYQLQSQGFTNIADFSKDGDKAYFMQDTIHMGWNGWLAMDKYVNPFLTKQQAAPTYTINDQFLSKVWAKYDAQPETFAQNKN